MRQNDFRSAAPVWAALSPLILWLAAIAAYAHEDGMNLFQWMGRFSQVLERPFAIGWTPYTLKYMLGSLLLYGCGIALYYSSRENRRPGEEYGSAKWGNPKELNRKYMDHRHKDANIILTQRVRLGMDGYITQRNMNVLVVGGSGSGKTRFFCKPNIYSANCSYLVTDPKGELLRAAGALLAAQGYEVRVFNLIDPSQSDGYNPFSYIHSEKDVLTLIDNLIKNTTPRNASSNDPFWEKAEIALDSALMLYLVSEAPPEEQNFEMLIYMMNFAEVREEDDQYRSPLDMLFRALEEEQPNHVAVKQYKAFKQAAGKTAKSILVSAAVRLATFNIPQYARMTMVDEMDFGSLGEKKKAIFCVIPVDDSSMNYLVGMLYTQCFQALYRRADEKHNGRLPVPVRVIQDEWANVAQPESYPKILATCRSYNIGLNIIVQNIQQIKALYEKEWAILKNAGIDCQEIEVKSNELFFLRDNQLVFPAAVRDKLIKTTMGRTLDIYVFSPRPLNDLLIEPNMPKLTLVVKTKKCQLSINDEVYAAAEKNRYEVTYKELPLLQGWNKISIAIGENDKNEFSGSFRCDNRNEFLPSLKASFVNPEAK